MAINLDFLDGTKEVDQTTTFSYSDLYLDFELDTNISSKPLNRKDTKTDVKLLYDIEAIKNSIKNIFNTKQGEKILNPTFGLDLGQYLFYPVNGNTAQMIYDTINEQLPVYEPRVDLVRVKIKGRPNQNEYVIDIVIKMPTLNNNEYTLNGTLNETGYTYN